LHRTPAGREAVAFSLPRIRCPLQADLAQIARSLEDHATEAGMYAWDGEVVGLKVSLKAGPHQLVATRKIRQASDEARRSGCPGDLNSTKGGRSCGAAYELIQNSVLAQLA
jgi:hypothetical protein